MLKILIIIIAIIVYKVLSNLVCYLAIQRNKNEFLDMLSGKDSKVLQHRQQTIYLWKRAGVKDNVFPVTQPTGYSQLASFNASIMENYPSAIKALAIGASRMFDEAEGVYIHRMLDSVNPMYWIDLILFLPKNLMLYLGFSESALGFKIANIIGTIFWWSATAFVTIFSNDIKTFLTGLFNHL